MKIEHLSQLDLTKSYTFEDYISWKFQEKVELLRGFVAKMSPAPNTQHQIIARQIFQELAWYLKKQTCQVFFAPYDIYLPQINGQGQTVVQPDICVICDTTKIKKHGCVGSPDLVVEILSPGNSRREMKDKYEIYQEAGVKEYWVVFPSEEVLQSYVLINGVFVPQRPYTVGDTINSVSISGFELEVASIFFDKMQSEEL
jgi:Uma2 family endonuclease